MMPLLLSAVRGAPLFRPEHTSSAALGVLGLRWTQGEAHHSGHPKPLSTAPFTERRNGGSDAKNKGSERRNGREEHGS